MTTHYNVTRVVCSSNYIDLTSRDRVLQLSNYAFDGSVFDIYGALLNGGILVLAPVEKVAAVDQLSIIITEEIITVFFVTTALFNLLVDEEPGIFAVVKKILFGGERVSVDHTRRALGYAGKHKIIHVYGPTETTVYASYYFVDELLEPVGTIPIGSPLANTAIYILDNHLQPLCIGIVGEIYIGGYGTARGYLNRQELSAERFILNLFAGDDRLYKTGDLGRWLPGGYVEFSGRSDDQVKIRGFRVEPGEIESRLHRHRDIKDAVVTAMEITGGKDIYICAYIVPARKLSMVEIKRYLSKELPDYMIPDYFVPMEKIPLTANGKVNRKALPLPEIKAVGEYAAPRGSVEEALVGLWSEVLTGGEQQTIGIDDNFFALGGHSLKATVLVSRIKKSLDVQLPLAEIFRTPTIRELAQYIEKAEKDRFASIAPVEKKDYYALSSAQKRLYILQQMDLAGTGYHITEVIPVNVKDSFDLEKMTDIFNKLIQRHESLRTSFYMIAGEPVQRIHDNVEFKIEHYEPVDSREEIIKVFIRPFDFSQAPLLHIGRLKLEEAGHLNLLLVDIHHIISDGLSQKILLNDFTALYGEEELAPLRIQYKDFSQWQNREKKKGYINQQVEYWLSQFKGEIPVLNLPADYARPRVQGFEGSTLSDEISCDTGTLKTIALENGATEFMVLLTIFNIFLFKISSREDVVVGTPIAGRRHPDLEGIMGMFVNSLALRNHPGGEKTFGKFLREVRESTLQAFDNQDFQFEDLVEKMALKRDRHNPLFDVMFTYQEWDTGTGANAGTDTEPGDERRTRKYGYESRTSKFDLTLAVMVGKKLSFSFEYSTKLFKKKTIEMFAACFKKIVVSVLEDKNIKLKEIKMKSYLSDTRLGGLQEELADMEF